MKNNLLLILFFSLLTIIVFFPFFLFGKIPFPGDYLMAWYQPWKKTTFINNSIGIAHKPIADDVFRQLYPYKILLTEDLKKGNLPLWNPYNGSGMPLMATMHAGILTPFNIFFLILPSSIGWSYYIILQFILVLLFTYLFAKKIGLSTFGSLISSIIFAFSGVVITRLIFGEYVYVLSFLPLLLYIAESYYQNPKTKIIYFLTPSVFVLMLSGQPQIILYTLIFAVLYCLFNTIKAKYKPSFFLKFMLFASLGVGLSSIQLIPTIELLNQASISSVSSKFIFSKFLLPIQDLITVLIPNYFGNQATYNYWGSSDYIETANYLGIIPCFLAYLAIFRKKGNELIKFFWVIVFITCISTLNWFVPKAFFNLNIPILSTGVPSRIFSITSFSLAILAGMGSDFILYNSKSFWATIKKSLPFILLILLILTGTIYAYKFRISCNSKFITDCRLIALRNTTLELALSLIFVAVLSLSKIKTNLFKTLTILLICAIGIYNAHKFLPFSNKATILPSTNLIAKVKDLDGRTFGIGNAEIKTDFATFFRYYDPNFYDPLYIRRYGELIDFANNGSSSLFLKRSDVEIISDLKTDKITSDRRERLFNILSVKNLIYDSNEIPAENPYKWADGSWRVGRFQSNPSMYLVTQVELLSQDKKILQRLFDKSFDPSKTVILEEKTPYKNVDDNLAYNISYQRVSPESIKAVVESQNNAVLILTDNYYAGWKAFIDNAETKIYRANYTFKAIIVPKGTHVIRFMYQPDSVKLGAILSAVSLLTYLFLTLKLVFEKISRQKYN